MKERFYPVYKIKAKWAEKIPENEQDKYLGDWIKNAPNGYFWNCCYKHYMPKTKQTDEQIKVYYTNWFNKLQKEIYDIKNLTITCNYLFDESWCPNGFSHWTYDIGQSDKDVLKSFINFIKRRTIENTKYGHYGNECTNGNYDTYYCLMGAEDWWRWCDNKPCRCGKQLKIITIIH